MSEEMQLANVVHKHIDQHFDEHLTLTKEIIQQPSISADGTGMEAMTRLLEKRLKDLGASAEIITTEGYPIILGVYNANAPRTLMIYGMYDTMPVEGEDWLCDPFAGEILDLPGIGPSIVARGAENSKGPLASVLNMLDSWRSVHGEFPVNLKFLFEGEEELGSPSMPAFIDENLNKLCADGGLFPALSQDRKGKPVMYLGFKGILFLELYVRGGDWGAPTERAVHSSRAVWYHSPAFYLVQALASLLSPDQRKILIEGFYDDVASIPESDQPLIASLAKTFDPDIMLQEDQVLAYKWDLGGIDLLKKYLYEPSLNIDGLRSGDTGPGAKTILPHDAFAKIDFRFVPDQRADRILNQLRGHFQKQGFPEVQIHLDDTTHWARTASNDPVVKAFINACRDFGFEPEVWPTHAGSSPMYLFTDVLKIPMVTGGLGHGGGAHGPDEYATLEGLRLCEKSLASFLEHYARG